MECSTRTPLGRTWPALNHQPGLQCNRFQPLLGVIPPRRIRQLPPVPRSLLTNGVASVRPKAPEVFQRTGQNHSGTGWSRPFQEHDHGPTSRTERLEVEAVAAEREARQGFPCRVVRERLRATKIRAGEHCILRPVFWSLSIARE